MKKILIAVIIVLFLSLAAVYILIPAKLSISSARSVDANRESVHRFLTMDSNWHTWWPGSVSKGDSVSSYVYDKYSFQIEKISYYGIQLKWKENGHSGTGILKVLPYNTDSTALELATELSTGNNPFSRIYGYYRAKKIKQMLDTIITSLQLYAGDIKNLYGITIKKEKVQYEYVLSVKRSFSHYPATEDIYTIIKKLRAHINRSGAKELFFPMLNIRETDSSGYIIQVGLPIDRKLPDTGDMSSKWLLKGGNILTGEVTGGIHQVNEGLKKIDQYISDYRRGIIAIPFQMLITDRSKEPDSTKWITRWYYPVI